MQSLKNAFSFISASFKLAFSNTKLRKPWWYFIVGGVFLLILWSLLIALVVGFIGLKPLGLMLTGALSTFFVTSLLIWESIASLKIIPTAIQALTEHPEAYSDTPKQFFSSWVDAALFALVLPVSVTSQTFRALFNKNANDSEQNWTAANFLILPIISLEDLSLKQAVQRTQQMVADNLMRFRPGLVPVGSVAGVAQWVCVVCGIIVGAIAANRMIMSPTLLPFWQQILPPLVGLAILGGFMLIGGIFSTYARSCYHAAIYLWVRNVENAHKSHDPQKGTPPKLLRQVLGTGRDEEKETINGTKKRNTHLE